MLPKMQVIGARRVLLQDLHRINNALASVSDEVGVVLLAHAGALGLFQYSQVLETVENRPEVHRCPRGIDDLRFGFDDTHPDSGLREAESVDETDWAASDDYYVFHRSRNIRVASSTRKPNSHCAVAAGQGPS